MTEEADRILAELHLARGLAAAPRPVGPAVSTAALWAHARRRLGAPVDLGTIRALREDPGAAARYRRLLEGLALAHAPVALAASDGTMRRRLGPAELELHPSADGALMVLKGAGGARAIEVIPPEGEPCRLALPAPEDGTVILSLAPHAPETGMALAALRDPGSAIFLLP